MSYFDQALDGNTLKFAIDLAINRLKKVKFDSIACRGNSGLAFAAPLAMMLGKSLLIVRKRTDNAHSSVLVEGHKWKTKNILIVDDFISSGKTMDAIIEAINDSIPEKRGHKFVGMYSYARDYEYDRKYIIKKDGLRTRKAIRVMTSDSIKCNLNSADALGD